MTSHFSGLSISLILFAAFTGVGRAEENWGALAYSPSTEVNGYAQGQESAADAKFWALNQCETNSNATDCSAIAFHDSCGAIAIGRKGWAAATGADEDAASVAAEKKCRRRTKECETQTVHCSP